MIIPKCPIDGNKSVYTAPMGVCTTRDCFKCIHDKRITDEPILDRVLRIEL